MFLFGFRNRFAFGSNRNGQLGLGDRYVVNAPTLIEDISSLPCRVASIVASADSSAINQDEKVWFAASLCVIFLIV